ncbi:MAG: preprotein translocase subunit SecA [Planctomycetota bacterium]|nr:preprotein translocase subunit SecA [Planctomycetota bacterium]
MSWDDITDKFSRVGEGFGRLAKRLVGSENEREVRRLTPVIEEINGLESWATGLDREGVQAEVLGMRESVRSGDATLDDCLTRMFALTRAASQRTLGMRHYDVQLVGGYVLHEGKIAEMRTGEGKTLMATLALALNALADRPCYLVTVNDYLARRDADWMRPIYEYLGLTVGAIQSSLDPSARKPVYGSDIVYATNNELGFDYLRDNMKTSLDQQVQKDLYFAIVDEVDSILIDEARTPLIISGPAEDHVGRYREADGVARQLVEDEHYEVKEKERQASLTEDGIVRAQEILKVESFYVPGFEDWPHYIENALRAHSLYEKDKEYVVEEAQDPQTGQMRPEVIIVDEFTGRKMAGRRWSDGLHQAVEVKEGLEPKQETQTLATITFQNYFRMFDKLAGMTGTAITEAGEFHKIYTLDVVQVPTNRPIARKDNLDVVFRTLPEKWNAICDEIERVQETGQPVLVGTASVENSEHLSGLLRERGVPHEVLNAKNHEREAHIVAMAGSKGAITVSTNMAGRGTDIKLGGNFEYRLEKALEDAGVEAGDLDHLDEIDRIRKEVEAQSAKDEAEILELGGLYVLGTERHEARRIDNQLQGRTGRQGDAGESRFYLSLQDPLMRIFYRDWVVNAMEKLGMSEGQPIESGMVARQVAKAQRKVEDRNFEIRKSLLEYDEVMDHQRTEIYSARQAVLEGEDLKDRVGTMISNVTDRQAYTYEGDAAGFAEWVQRNLAVGLDGAAAEAAVSEDQPDLKATLEPVDRRYEQRREGWGPELTSRIESYLVLTAIDQKWKDHLHAMDALKAGIGLRGYGQQDPKIAYKKEATELFAQNLLPAIESDVTSKIMRIEVSKPEGEGAEEAAGDGLAPRGIAPTGRPAPQRQVRFDELPLEQQRKVIEQLPDEQKLMAVMQAGEANQGTLLGELPPELRERFDEVKRQLEERRAQQVKQQQAMQQAQRGPAASAAFDVMRRRRMLEAQQQAQREAQEQAAGGDEAGAAPVSGQPAAPAAATAKRPAPQRAAGAGAAQKATELPPEFRDVGRNDPCPCGSGKKFKKCCGK